VARVLDATAACHVTAGETAGAFAVFELTLPSGVCVPPHRHADEDESCYVVAGRVRFGLERRVTTLRPGGHLYVPRGERHAYRNPGPDVARLLLVVSPGSSDGRVFSELALGFATGPHGSPELAAVMWQIAGTHGITPARTRRRIT
jgi:quercetin dioxygenase-like cupin family protein